MPDEYENILHRNLLRAAQSVSEGANLNAAQSHETAQGIYRGTFPLRHGINV